MSDLFQDAVPAAFIRRVWATMAATPHHTYQILTKRPARMAALCELPLLQNVWLGTTWKMRKSSGGPDHLRDTRAAVRFVSFEPLIGWVTGADLTNIHWAIVGGESGPRARPISGRLDRRNLRAMSVPQALRSSSSSGAAGTRRRPGRKLPWSDLRIRCPKRGCDRQSFVATSIALKSGLDIAKNRAKAGPHRSLA